jgi:hypothetical protein
MSAFADALGGWMLRPSAAPAPAAPQPSSEALVLVDDPQRDAAPPAGPPSAPDVQFAEIAAQVEDSLTGYSRRAAAARKGGLVWWGVAAFVALLALLALLRLAWGPSLSTDSTDDRRSKPAVPGKVSPRPGQR